MEKKHGDIGRLVLLGGAVGSFCSPDGYFCQDRASRRGFRSGDFDSHSNHYRGFVGILFYSGKWSNPFDLSPSTWLFLGLSGLATGASWVCYFRALKIGEASKVAPVDKLSIVLVAVFAFAFLGERPSLREWSGIAMVAGGVLLLAFKR
jgi:drug/metabolite transporter (DMT)-like permease